MHTHNGMRIQGLNIVKPILDLGLGVCLFDFNGNGHSTGEFVTFGFTEMIDLDDVLRFLRAKLRAKSFILWGRSMGAATAILHLSDRFRDVIKQFLVSHYKCNELNFLGKPQYNIRQSLYKGSHFRFSNHKPSTEYRELY